MQANVLRNEPGESSGAAKCLSLSVHMPDGGVLSPHGVSGTSVSDVLAAYGLPVMPQGEGKILSLGRTGQRHADPAGRDCTDGRVCRLSDVVMTPELDGLEIELSWAALVPQTYWTAG